MNLNTGEWTYYRLGDLFEIRKGNRLTSENRTDGKTPYIGAISSNNGVSSYIGQEPMHEGNTISLSYNGSVGEAFYQPRPFWATDDVNVLYFREENNYAFNKYVALFICTILRQEKYRYCYGRKWTLKSMSDSEILLPSKEGKPDWIGMEEYMKELHHKPITTGIQKYSSTIPDISLWENFYLHRIMNVQMGNGIDAIQITSNNPKYNYVSRNSNNNGIISLSDEIEGEIPFPAGSMTLALGGSFLGSCFVQAKPYYTAQNVAVLQEKVPISTHGKLFLATLIRNECKVKYQAFGRELNSHFKRDFIIRLPVKRDSSGIAIIDSTYEFSDNGYIPDWEWMDRYMHSLPFSDRI